MKKSKKLIIGYVLLALGIIGILGLFGEDGFSGELLLGSVFLIAGGVALVLLDSKEKKTANEIPTITDASTSSTAPTEPKTPTIPDGEKDYNLFPYYANGQFLCYEYEKQICFIKEDNIDEKFEYIIGNGGKQLLFQFEPENEYDNMAVALYLNENKLGYVYSGQTQDMIHSYYNKGWEICAYINKYSKENKTATYKIAFYKPKECFESKQFSLTKTTKKIDEYSNRADNLHWCKEGGFATIELDSIIDGNYVVFANGYNEVGELPKSAVNFIEENNPNKIYGIFDSLEEDENGKLKAKITVYLI